MTKILIIGGGECAVRAAFSLREFGHKGSVTILSSEAVYPYERPPLSKELNSRTKLIRDEKAYADAQIVLQFGAHVEALNTEKKQISLADGSLHDYDKLLIATGARAHLFPGMENCLTFRTQTDARQIFDQLDKDIRIGLIGGGFIGLELAAIARKAGADVTVIEAASRLLARAVPEEIAAFVQARHESEGVELRTGIQVAEANSTSITLDDGTQLTFDLIVAGVGARPNTQLAEDAKIEVENGIVVDQSFQTSVPDIYAAGDCCNFMWRGNRVRLESWKAAQDQGAHVAAAMMGADDEYTKVPWFWSDQYDMTLQVAGLFDLNAVIHSRHTGDESRIVFQCDLDGTLCAAAGIGHGRSVAKDIRIFEKLIGRQAKFDPVMLADQSTNLKRLLKVA